MKAEQLRDAGLIETINDLHHDSLERPSLKSGQYWIVCDDHCGTLEISFFTEDDQNRRVPVLFDSQAEAQAEINDHLQECKDAMKLGYLQDYEDSGYVIAPATLAGDHLLVSIDDYVVYEGSVFDVAL